MDSHSVDIRADLYGLGCTLYYLLAGQAPFLRRHGDGEAAQAPIAGAGAVGAAAARRAGGVSRRWCAS